jgi:hypothetical protein
MIKGYHPIPNNAPEAITDKKKKNSDTDDHNRIVFRQESFLHE